MERALEVLIKVGLEGRLEGTEGGFEAEGKWEGVPHMWAVGVDECCEEYPAQCLPLSMQHLEQVLT